MLIPPEAPEIRRVVDRALTELLDEIGAEHTEFTAEDALVSLGLGSLDLAQLVAQLEADLDADPFRELVAITDVRTVGDLAGAYTRFFEGASAPDSTGAAARDRAARRRDRRRVRSHP